VRDFPPCRAWVSNAEKWYNLPFEDATELWQECVERTRTAIIKAKRAERRERHRTTFRAEKQHWPKLLNYLQTSEKIVAAQAAGWKRKICSQRHLDFSTLFKQEQEIVPKEEVVKESHLLPAVKIAKKVNVKLFKEQEKKDSLSDCILFNMIEHRECSLSEFAKSYGNWTLATGEVAGSTIHVAYEDLKAWSELSPTERSTYQNQLLRVADAIPVPHNAERLIDIEVDRLQVIERPAVLTWEESHSAPVERELQPREVLPIITSWENKDFSDCTARYESLGNF
jgi:hypothetical protein